MQRSSRNDLWGMPVKIDSIDTIIRIYYQLSGPTKKGRPRAKFGKSIVHRQKAGGKKRCQIQK